ARCGPCAVAATEGPGGGRRGEGKKNRKKGAPPPLGLGRQPPMSGERTITATRQPHPGPQLPLDCPGPAAAVLAERSIFTSGRRGIGSGGGRPGRGRAGNAWGVSWGGGSDG